MKWLPLLLVVAGCGYANQVMVWPLRGAFLEVSNPTEEAQIVVARDGQGREWQVARIKAHGRACFRWPFIHQNGFLRTDGDDRIVTQQFEPWSAAGWSWPLAGQPVQNAQACR